MQVGQLRLIRNIEGQRRIHNPVKHLRWRFLRQFSAANYFCKKLHLQCFTVFWIHLGKPYEILEKGLYVYMFWKVLKN